MRSKIWYSASLPSTSFKSGYLMDCRTEKGDSIQFPPLDCSVGEAKAMFRKFPCKAVVRADDEKTALIIRSNVCEKERYQAGTMLVLERNGFRPIRINGEDRVDAVLLEPINLSKGSVKAKITTAGILTPHVIAEINGIKRKINPQKPASQLKTYSLFYAKANIFDSWADLLYSAGFKLTWSYYSFGEMCADMQRRYKLSDFYAPSPYKKSA